MSFARGSVRAFDSSQLSVLASLTPLTRRAPVLLGRWRRRGRYRRRIRLLGHPVDLGDDRLGARHALEAEQVGVFLSRGVEVDRADAENPLGERLADGVVLKAVDTRLLHLAGEDAPLDPEPARGDRVLGEHPLEP